MGWAGLIGRCDVSSNRHLEGRGRIIPCFEGAPAHWFRIRTQKLWSATQGHYEFLRG
jgi:hypothetical protein